MAILPQKHCLFYFIRTNDKAGAKAAGRQAGDKVFSRLIQHVSYIILLSYFIIAAVLWWCTVLLLLLM